MSEDNVALFDKACELGIVSKKGSWFKYGDLSLGMGRDAAIEGLGNLDPEVVENMTADVAAKSDAPPPTIITETRGAQTIERPPDLSPQAIANIGVMDHVTTSKQIITVEENGQPFNQVVEVRKTERLAQPLIEITEAKINAPYAPKEQWHEYKMDRHLPSDQRRMTVAVKVGPLTGRRLMMTKEEFAKW